jgi:hypothetical protein
MSTNCRVTAKDFHFPRARRIVANGGARAIDIRSFHNSNSLVRLCFSSGSLENLKVGYLLPVLCRDPVLCETLHQ